MRSFEEAKLIGANLASSEKQYDEFDAFFREAWGTAMHHGLWITGSETLEEAKKNLQDLILVSLDLKPGLHILDVGGGYGALAQRLIVEAKVSVEVVTNSSKQYDYLQQLAGRIENGYRLKSHCGDWEHADFSLSHQFDRVVAVEFLEHVQSLDIALSRLLRALKPGGSFVLSTWRCAEKSTASIGFQRFALPWIERAGALASFTPLSTLTSVLSKFDGIEFQHDRITDQVAKTWSEYPRTLLKGMWKNKIVIGWLIRHPLRSIQLALASILIQWGFCSGNLEYYLVRGKLSS